MEELFMDQLDQEGAMAQRIHQERVEGRMERLGTARGLCTGGCRGTRPCNCTSASLEET